MAMKIDGDARRALDAAITQGFSYDELKRLVRYHLDVSLEDIVAPNATRVTAVFELMEYAERRRILPKLIEGARSQNPALSELQLFFQLSGAGPIRKQDDLDLQKVITQRSRFQDPAGFRERMGSIETWVCRVEIPGGGGTGLLVHEDLVLTNHHVMQPVYNGEVSRDDVRFRFDYKVLPDGTELIGKTLCSLADVWDVDKSPPSAQDEIIDGAEAGPEELDYALVQLREKVGRQSIGSSDPQAPLRSWYQLVVPPAVKKNEPLLVMQYPGDLRLQLAIGLLLQHTPGGMRIRHNARTLGGSSGSPCFDANLELVALHHAGEPDRDDRPPAYNQAIPAGRILELLQKHAVRAFWKDVPP